MYTPFLVMYLLLLLRLLFFYWPSSISFLISFTSSSQLFLFVFCSVWWTKGTQTRTHVGPIYVTLKTRIFSLWRIGFLFFAPCRVYRRNVMNEHCLTVWVAVGSECHIVVSTARIQLFIVNIHGILQLQIIRSWHLNWGVLHLQFRVVMFDITMVWSVTHETRNLINIEYEHHETT